MRVTFTRCFLVNFAVDPAALAAKLPTHLEPDVHAGRAYVSIVVALMKDMRPAFVPAPLGITYSQVVYRAVVKCGAERGVTFLRSDADNSLMVAAGNALTFFRFNRAKISWNVSTDSARFSLGPAGPAQAARIDADYDLLTATDRLPESSRFADLRTAQAFLTELYSAFGSKRADGRVEVVRIARTDWGSQVIEDRRANYEAMSSGALFSGSEACLDSIFYVEDLAYRWNRLTLERL